jgi:cell division protease FtsH
MANFEDAKDKVMMGAERRSHGHDRGRKRNTAYHEPATPSSAQLCPSTDPVHKVTIIPRGRPTAEKPTPPLVNPAGQH